MTLEDMEIKDSTADLLFAISKSDISAAVRQNNACCAAANGLMRDSTVEKVRIGLSVSYVKFANITHWLRYQTPSDLYMEIVALDRGGEFVVGDYYLAKMPKSETSRRGRGHTKRPAKHSRPYETKRRPHYVLVGVRTRVDAGAKKPRAKKAK